LLRLGEEDLRIKVAETWRGLHHHTAVSVYLALVSSLPCPCTHMHTGENLYQNVLITWGETANTCRGTAETWRGGAETWGGAGETWGETADNWRGPAETWGGGATETWGGGAAVTWRGSY